MNILQKLKETLASVSPIIIIVCLLGVTITPLGLIFIIRFLIGGILVVIGLTLFLLGVDIGILPVGERSGAVLTTKRNLSLLLIVSFVIGVMVTVAEPDVQVLADQVRSINSMVNKWTLIFMIAGGLGVFVSLGIFRIIVRIPLNIFFIVSYIFVFLLAFLVPSEYRGVAFDAGGATTGPMTVPFIMSLGVGIAAVRTKIDNKKGFARDDSFGLTGIASIGPIAAVFVYGILLRHVKPASIIIAPSVESFSSSSIYIFIQLIPLIVREVMSALFPLILMFLLFQLFLLKMPPFQVIRMVRGLVFCFLGLVLFLVGSKGGFMPVGRKLGETLGIAAVQGRGGMFLLMIIGFVFGAIVVCAEPAVWVLTDQVESVSGGTIKRGIMITSLSLGVAISIVLSMTRVMFGFSLWYFIIPGYTLSLILSLFCPKLFTGIAFDSGGVASGPMTSTFIMSFMLGASQASGGDPATDAFGVIALVAMTPLITIQILGIIFKLKGGSTE